MRLRRERPAPAPPPQETTKPAWQELLDPHERPNREDLAGGARSLLSQQPWTACWPEAPGGTGSSGALDRLANCVRMGGGPRLPVPRCHPVTPLEWRASGSGGVAAVAPQQAQGEYGLSSGARVAWLTFGSVEARMR